MSSNHPVVPSTIFGVRRDGAATASSTSELLVTILGELLRPNAGAAWTQTITDALRLFDVEDKAARQALSRLSAQGWLTGERVGRRTRWHLTPWATSVLDRGAQRIYGFGQQPRDWDGMWLVLLVSVPEARRAIRRRLGVRLGWAGFGSLGQGVWISPWADREPEVKNVLTDLKIGDATLFRSELTEIGDRLELAQSAWRPAETASRYEAFLDECDSPAEPQTSDDPAASAARALISIVHTWRAFPLLDPDLPLALLPADWPGPIAARRFAELRAAWSPRATRWWTATDRRYDPT